ncbi:MAG: ribonuclease HII [Acetobacteraceae bacterium]|nr:ribonuclease HII [Acetobacteraceae bacterium]
MPGKSSKPRPTLALERAAGGIVAGVDEVGRGPLSGPVVAAAVILPPDLPPHIAALLNDSKKLSPVARDIAWNALQQSGAMIGVGAASVADIARLNILHASMLAMQRAVRRLAAMPDLALIDGNRAPSLPCASQCVVGGDARSLSIAAASIVAKVLRDRLMARLDLRYPGYGWADNAGYGTPVHLAGLARLGATPHHRAAFAPVAAVLNFVRNN